MQDSELLKKWIIAKLETISDADSEVLADYILALVEAEDPNPSEVIENLRDFLGDNTVGGFVQELFATIASKAYDPNVSVPAKPIVQPHQLPQYLRAAESRKRPHVDWDRDNSQNGHAQTWGSGGSDRPIKHARRGRGGFDLGGRHTQSAQFSAPQLAQQNLPMMPPLPPGMPPFDPNDPMAAFLAMQQVMGMMPGGPGFPSTGLPNSKNQNGGGLPSCKERCRQFDAKGYCARGTSCRFEHGDAVPSNDEYDPNNASLLDLQPAQTGFLNTVSSPRNRASYRGRGQPGNTGVSTKRAAFSQLGQNHDRSISTVVVEQIPEDHFDEQSVRAFFGEFGDIVEVTMQPYKRLAIVKYDDYHSAKAAYDSPKVIFDNRFVKVYWYNADGLPKPSENWQPAAAKWQQTSGEEVKEEEPELDTEEIARRQEELQRKQDEKRKINEEATKKREELDAKLKATEAERQVMLARLAKKTGKPGLAATEQPKNGQGDSAHTASLKAKLAELEAEAKSLGIDPDAPMDGTGTFGYRGRGGYRGRPRGQPYYRSTRGGRGGGVSMRLDNRPKSVIVTFLFGSYEEHEEALRQWLLFNAEYPAELVKGESPDTALISFEERYQAEAFMKTPLTPESTLTGKIDVSWYKPDATNGTKQEGSSSARPEAGTTDVAIADEEGKDHEVDTFDIADDNDDRWE